MCDICVINSVKERMISRRDVLKATPVAVAAATVGAAPAALAQPAPTRVVDLTHKMTPDFPTYFGTPGFSSEQMFNFAEHGFNVFNLAINEHTATHIDAPLHFSADGHSVDNIPVEDLVCPVAVIDIRAKADTEADAQVTPDDLNAWKAANGDFPERCCIALYSGWEGHIGTDKFRGADDAGTQHYPGFHVEAAQMLLEETTAVGLASDTLSLDIGSSGTFDTHYAWLPTNRWGLENVANLGALPANGATIIVGAPTHGGGSGGPTRVIALV